MRVLLTGGGTSGHVTPALAIADIIRARETDSEFAYVGTPNGIEKRLVEKEGIPFYPINIQGISRSLSLSNLRTAYLIMTAPAAAKKIIKQFRPDVVIGTGGYVCWAPLKAAAELGIPTVIHESNSTPGLAVRKLEDKVDLILTNFKSCADKMKNAQRAVCVGNPIRVSFGDTDKTQARKRLGIPDSAKFVILSFGGSLGAPGLNGAAIEVMRRFGVEHEDVMHFHAGGKKYYDNAMQMFAGYSLEKHPRLSVREYIYDMSLHMAAADLVICRAGAMTLTELSMMGKAAILVPSPHVTDDHQYKNASVLVDEGAAVLIRENDNTADGVVEAVQRLYADPDLRRQMSERIRAFSNPQVDEEIYGQISRLLVNNAKIKRKS